MKMPKKKEMLVLPEDHITHFAKKWMRFVRMKGKPAAKQKLAEIKEKMKRFQRLAPLVEKAYWEGHRKKFPVRYQAIALAESVLEKVLAGEPKAKIKQAHLMIMHNYSLETFREKYGRTLSAPAERVAVITFKLQEELAGYLKRNWNTLSEYEKKQLQATKHALPEINLGLLDYNIEGKTITITELLLRQAETVHKEAITHLIGESKYKKFNQTMGKATDLLIERTLKERETNRGGARKLTKKEAEARRQSPI